MKFPGFCRFLVLYSVVGKIHFVTANENHVETTGYTPRKDAQLIFDITNHIKDTTANVCNSTPTFQFDNQWKLSSLFYLRTLLRTSGTEKQKPVHYQNPDTRKLLEELKYLRIVRFNSVIPLENETHVPWDIALLATTEQLCNNANLGSFTKIVRVDQVALRLTSSSPECRITCLRLSVLYRLFLLENISVGIEVDQRFFECLLRSCQTVFFYAKFFVLNTELESMASTLSYGGFVRQMNSILLNEYEVWKRNNPRGWFYIRISIKETLAIEREKADYVKTFVEQFATAWLKSRSNVSIILETYKMPANMKLKSSNTIVIPSIDFNPDRDYSNDRNNDPDVRWNDFPSTCEFWQAVQTADQVFKAYLINVPNGFALPQLNQECNTNQAKKHLLNDTPVSTIGSERQDFLQKVSSETENPEISQLPRNLQADLKSKSDKNMLVLIPGACLEAEHHDSSDLCQLRNQISTRAVKLYRKYATENTAIDILNTDLSAVLLNSGYAKRENSAEGLVNPAFWVDFRITVSTSSTAISRSKDDLKHLFHRNLFCSEDLYKSKEMHEALINWAKIHDFFVTPFPLVDSTSRTGWWYQIVTIPQVNRSLTNFTVLVRRNVPFSLDPEFTNVNLDSLTNLTVLSENHIRALMFIALSRFKDIYIKANSNAAKRMVNALNANFEEKRPQKVGKHSKDANLFLELDATDLSNLNELQNVRFPLAGVHVSGCHSQAECPTANLVRILNKMELKYGIGIVIDNCIDEINDGLNGIKNHPLFDLSSHIVCQGRKGVLISENFRSQNWIQKLLDTTLYVQKYFNFHLKKGTYWKFRFDNLCTDSDSELGYLRFMDVVSQYAEGYKINYILGDAFVNCSWWHIDNYNDLLNASTYVERATGERLTSTLIDGLVSSYPLSLVISLSVVALILFAGICGLYVYHRLNTKKLLSKQEVNAFHNGEEIEVNTELIGVHVQVHTTRILGFNKAFEIPKKNISIGHLIGSGNFGQVSEGTMNDGQKVAIKQPRPDCSKEVFVTMLGETKVLSYLGDHDNVVKFIGAYTKEIDVGIIYILTEFCENGSLEYYLTTKFKLREGTINVTSENPHYASAPNAIREQPNRNEFCRFAMEIASGMNYITERKIVHADLSTRNVLLNGKGVCKIADFGLSRKLYESGIYRKEGKEELPWRWMSIESLKNREFTTKSDVWSYAVTLWEIFSLGETPYPGVVMWDDKFTTRLESGYRMFKPEFASDEIYETMLSCWNLAPEERPTFLEVYEFFRNLETMCNLVALQ